MRSRLASNRRRDTISTAGFARRPQNSGSAINLSLAPLDQPYTPKLLTVFSEGYRLSDLRADIVAGLTVAVVALPLSMAIAVASGTTPERGLFAAIVGGFFISAFGGSRFQIGGPAGAFIVLVASAVARHGIDGVILATALSGCFLLVAGLLRLGSLIRLIPLAVTVGFTAGIAVIIFVSQIKDSLGLHLAGPEPGEIVPKVAALARAIATTSPAAICICLVTVGIIVGVRRYCPRWPGMLVAIVVVAFAAWALGLPVETIGSRFGQLPSPPPLPALPEMSFAKIQAVLPDALAFTLLGAIESLLSAVVADGMTRRRHRPNCELVAQGIGNIGSALFGGICVTGTIARTATNIRAGARSPMAGMIHSAALLLLMLVAAPLCSFIPMAALAGVLMLVAWNMVEKHEFAVLLRTSVGLAVVLMATLLLTVFRDLTEGIVAGVALSALLPFVGRVRDWHGRRFPRDK